MGLMLEGVYKQSVTLSRILTCLDPSLHQQPRRWKHTKSDSTPLQKLNASKTRLSRRQHLYDGLIRHLSRLLPKLLRKLASTSIQAGQTGTMYNASTVERNWLAGLTMMTPLKSTLPNAGALVTGHLSDVVSDTMLMRTVCE